MSFDSFSSNIANPISKSMTSGYTFTINVVKNLGKLQVVSGGVSCPAGGTSAGNYLFIANVPDAPANNIVLPANVIYSTYTYPTKIKISTNKKVEVFVSNKMYDDIGQNTAEVIFSGASGTFAINK